MRPPRGSLEKALGQRETLQRLDDLRGAHDAIDRRQSDRHVFGLVTAFLASPEFTALKPSTRTAYRSYLERLRDEFGADRVNMFEKAAAVEDLSDWRDEMADTPRAADYAIQAVSRLFSWARSRGKTLADPSRDIARLHKVHGSYVIRTEADLLALARRCGAGRATNPRRPRSCGRCAWPPTRAFVRATCSGFRGRPCRIWRSPCGRPSASAWRSSRSPRRHASCSPAFWRRGPVVLISSLGRPWTSDGFRASFRKACLAAGVCKRFHDLRGTAATRLKSGTDLSNEQIAQIMGWRRSASTGSWRSTSAPTWWR